MTLAIRQVRPSGTTSRDLVQGAGAAMIAVMTAVWVANRHAGMLGVAGALGGCALVAWLAWQAVQSVRIEADDWRITKRALWHSTTLGVAGSGQLVRADFGQPPLLGGRQFWLDAQGQLIAALDERQWGGDQMAAMAEQLRIPITDLGATSVAQFRERYPSVELKLWGVELGPDFDTEPKPLGGAERARVLALAAVIGVGALYAIVHNLGTLGQ